MPDRIQLRRTAGWRKPEGVVVVSRPSRFGNPFTHDGTPAGKVIAAGQFRLYLRQRANPPTGWADVLGYPSDEEIRRDLGGKSLACWCPVPAPGEPDHCHAAVLLDLAAALTSDTTKEARHG